MKKITLIAVVLFLAKSVSAQMVVDAEMFKANPNQFMGKVVTIQNVVYKGASTTAGGAQGGVVSGNPSSGAGAGAPSKPATGLAGGTGGGPAKDLYCNPAPNFTLTKWTLGPNNNLCMQVDARIKPMVDMCQVGGAVKSISFRCTPNMYVATRVEK